MEEPSFVKIEVLKFFSNRMLIDDFGVRLDNVSFQKITEDENCMLIAPFEELEIKEDVWECGSDKSPGPDGLSFSFIKLFWHFINKDFVKAIQDFHAHGCFSKGCNASFISLIPKYSNPQSLDEYRPISLVRSIYKVIYKILPIKIKKVSKNVIDSSQ